jgi:phosphopantothenoylcysteine decarboxylase
MQKHILLGVTGSIAAYKAVDIASKLTQKGCAVHVVMTENAAEFIAPLTFQSITHNKVHINMFSADYEPTIEHISLAKQANLAIIAPATANTIAKLACGLADNQLTSTFLALPKLTHKAIAPAMNTAMYENSITQENIAKLKQYGYEIIQPRESMLACGDVGNGAMEKAEVIVEWILKRLG